MSYLYTRLQQAVLARPVRLFVICALGALTVGVVVSQVTPAALPLVNLASEPLYARGLRAKPTLTLALSVEFPTVGQTYPATDNYSPATPYLGYFDSESCYTYSDAGQRFDRSGAASNRTCGGAGFSGNFMNWASSSAIDILRYGLTGGDRVIDTPTTTVLQRAVIPASFYNSSNFNKPAISNAIAQGALPAALLSSHTGNVYVANCLERIHFGTQQTGSCATPGNNGNLGVGTAGGATSWSGPLPGDFSAACATENGTCSFSGTQQVAYGANDRYVFMTLTGGTACTNGVFSDPIVGVVKQCYTRAAAVSTGALTSQGHFKVRVSVCTSSGGNLTDPRPDLCARYANGNYKPIGNLQKYSDRMRVAAFGYLRDDTLARHGGVLRAPMKYAGSKAFDANFNLIAGTNGAQEWDPATGVLVANPDGAAEGISGVTNYLNQFGRTGALGVYKTYDPVGELYYEALRYLQGLPPTTQAVSGITTEMRDGYPVHTSWTDPHPQISGLGATGDYSCVRNNILTIGDVNTHADKSLPGNASTSSSDFSRVADPAGNEPDFSFWTQVAGAFESNHTEIAYTDAQGATRSVSNPNAPNTGLWGLQNQANVANGENCCNNNGYMMVGAAYWANTHDIRSAQWSDTAKRRPGMRVKSYFVDVNEYGQQNNLSKRRNSQFYLAAKYGGFTTTDATRGNPFYGDSGTADNTIWQQGNAALDPTTYFLAGNANALLAALDKIFARVASEAASIAGGAITTKSLTVDAGSTIYQASFDPEDWGGDLISFSLALNSDGTIAVGTPAMAPWKAATVLKQRAAPRNIVVGKTVPTASLAGTNFLWDELDDNHKASLMASPPVDAATGAQRLAYLRGDQSQEAPAGPFRRRSSLVGDIVNSGVVLSGAPSQQIGDGGYASFYDARKNRVKALFVGANDGMLHAVNAVDGSELFAYVPGFLVAHLPDLTSPTYVHRSYVDATPAVGEANLGSATSPDWRTVLVSGVGAGAQGVFALDVTDPDSFGPGNVLWEFTDADDADLGNVVGKPQIVKLRTSAPSASVTSYKWFAVFASGVNNYADDGRRSTSGAPALFFLDLSKARNAAWAQGTNYFKVLFPQASSAIASGMVSFSATGGHAGELDQIYAGDLQGALWKLDFNRTPATNATAVDVSSLLGGSAVDLVASDPLFVAKDGVLTSANPQPITMQPAVLFGPNRTSIVVFGTGKFLEPADVSGPFGRQSAYAILDDNHATVAGRSLLGMSEHDAASGAVSVARFVWGIPSSDADQTRRAGWFFDFGGSSNEGERLVSGITVIGNRLVFGSLVPAANGCDAGSGRVYVMDQSAGTGSSYASSVGILGEPFVLRTQSGAAMLTVSDSTGMRKQNTQQQIVVQGSEGVKALPDAAFADTMLVGRISWRQINNYHEIRNAP